MSMRPSNPLHSFFTAIPPRHYEVDHCRGIGGIEIENGGTEMEEKTVVITGGDSGLGYQCAKSIATNSKDYAVVIADRDPERSATAMEGLRQETGNPHIYALELDLASIGSIRKFHDAFRNERYPPLYGIVCSAELSPSDLQYTKDGFEMTFGVNHLGHYLLANLMLDQMASNGRVVFVTSDAHRLPPLPCSAPTFVNARQLAYPEAKEGEHAAMLRYRTSKLCNILCAYEMAARLRKETDRQITVNAFDPGLMTGANFTPQPSNSVAAAGCFMAFFAGIIGRFGNIEESGKTLAALITDERYEHVTAGYYDRGKESRSSEHSYDKTAARDLWIESAELVKLKQGESILSIT